MMLILIALMQVAPPQCLAPVPLREGDAAPCDGSLYTLELRRGMLKELQATKAELAGALQIAETWRAALTANRSHFTEVLADRSAEFAKAQTQCVADIAAAATPEPIPVYERPGFIWPVAIVSTLVAVLGGVWLLEKTRP